MDLNEKRGQCISTTYIHTTAQRPHPSSALRVSAMSVVAVGIIGTYRYHSKKAA